MKHLNKLTTVALFIVGASVYLGIGGGTKGVVAICAMVMSLVAGAIMAIPERKPYHMSDDELRRAVDELDDTAGFLVKEATLKFLIEDAVNRDRGTHIEYHTQELKKALETNQPE